MEFYPGDYLEIEIFDGFYRGEYSSLVVKQASEELVVNAPRLGGNIIPFKPGQQLKVSFPKKDARYNYESKVASLEDRGYGYLKLNLDKKTEKQQRREDVRLNIKIPVEILYFYRSGSPVAACTVTSFDLSAGGIRIEIPNDYPLYTKFKLALLLPEEEIQVNSVIVRTGPVERPEMSINSYWASLRFFNISDNKRKKILKFIYKQQELRVKGLI